MAENDNQQYCKIVAIQKMTSHQKCQVESILSAAYRLPFDPNMFSYEGQAQAEGSISVKIQEDDEAGSDEEEADSNDSDNSDEEEVEEEEDEDEVGDEESEYPSEEQEKKNYIVSNYAKLLQVLNKLQTNRLRNVRKRKKTAPNLEEKMRTTI